MAGFRDILGNDFLKEQLRKAAGSDSVSHAYLIEAAGGMGKKTLAEAFALTLLCGNRTPDGDACGECPACKKVLSGNHPDVITVVHERDVIGVDEIREQVNDTVGIRPYAGGKKVYIIPDAELMTPQAQNALLKTLEEPPDYAVILLLANDAQKLLQTVLSRCVRIRLKPRTDGQIRQYLSENFEVSEERLDLCIAFAQGNIGRAIRFLTDESFSVWYDEAMRTLGGIRGMDASQIAAEAAVLRKLCPNLQDLLELFQLWYRELMMFKITKDMNGLAFRDQRMKVMELAAVYSYDGVTAIMEDIETCGKRLRANVNPELSLELLLLNMKEK